MNEQQNNITTAFESVDRILAPAEPARRTDGTSGDVATEAVPHVADLRNYSLDGLNIKGPVPLERIVQAVRRFRSGVCRPDVSHPRLNILLSGVPGSGKTAFVEYLAHTVGAPLRTLGASDLLSKWIGETEKNLAKAFENAKRERAILFLDEVDSFLYDRSGAGHSWEVSSVNELLQQMEKFEGVMIGATNFLDRLDPAVLRRFTFKLQLDYLTDAGKRIFFDRYFHSPLSDEEGRRLDAIDRLAPGDFRTVCENLFYLYENATNAERLSALQAESAAKGKVQPPIGF